MKKVLFYVQIFAVLATLLFYLGGITGLYAQFFLGIIQVLSAVVLLVNIRTMSSRVKRLFAIYGILVITVFLMLGHYLVFELNEQLLIAGMVLAMLTAIYFTFFTYKVMKDKERLSHRGSFSILDFPED